MVSLTQDPTTAIEVNSMCTEVIYLQRSQIDAASEMFSCAFHNDPAVCDLTPKSEPARTNAIQYICKTLLRYCQPYNHTYKIGDVKGCAAWIPPGRFPLNLFRLLQVGFYQLPFQVGLSQLPRWLEVFELDEYHVRDLSQPHWYLMLLGVAPSYQGQGIGSLLLQPVLKQADERGLACYTETSTAAAVRFYQRHGFEIVRAVNRITDVSAFWTLKRKPLQSRS